MWNASIDLAGVINDRAVRDMQAELDQSLLAFESDDGGREDVDGHRLSKSGWIVEDGRLLRPNQLKIGGY